MNRLNSQQTGNGPTLVMLHGLFGDLDNFRSIALHMERVLSVTRLDLPGHGRSAALPEMSHEHMAMAVLEEIGHLGIRDFHLLGHSLGGKVAMSMAGNANCKGLLSLTVVDIAPKAYPPHHQAIFDALLNLDLETLSDRREADTRLRESIPDAGVRAFLLKSLYRHESERYRWRFDLKQLANDYPLMSKPPVVSNRIEVPTLFIKGGKSNYLTPEDEAGIKAICTQPSIQIIPGTGHWPHAEKPAQFTRVCQEFIGHV